MYCNPKVYNFSNLGKEHQAIFETMLNQTLYSIYRTYREYICEIDISDNTLEKICYEERKEAMKEILNNFLADILEAMVVTLDEHCDDWGTKEIDTDNYFYGYILPDGLEELEKETSYLNKENCIR